ncbi:CorA family divalent cation transporter [Abyssisolibacter fermentans]|uniref:CorA family divalent cation transporter n=1 Tax=Abyssisolibacter fermentans TaxID=1766203 RepID=UPI00082D1EF7|nr:CorA family divalent cation transporter [Abyssisolibacter fermentans]
MSAHIFIFPFKWEYSGKQNKKKYNSMLFKNKIDISKFKKFLYEENWKYVQKFKSDNDYSSEYKKILNGDKYKIHKAYNEYVYFYDNVRDAIYTKEDNKENIVENYIFNKNDGKYKIYCFGKEEKKIIEYILDIEKIELKVYTTGIAIMAFHLENNRYKSKEDILRINEFGRRLYPSFLPLKDAKESILAYKIILEFGNKEEVYEDFKTYELNNQTYPKFNLIIDLLSQNEKFTCSKNEPDKIFIEPIIDDRMFTMCFYNYNAVSDYLKHYDSSNCTYNYENSEYWDKLVFVDAQNSSCQNRIMRRQLLKKHTYSRWVDYGTLYGITMYSFIALSNGSDSEKENKLLQHHKTMYYQMVCLSLAQRASVLKFSSEASKISDLASLDNKKTSKELNDKVTSLHKQYIRFINKLHFREVSAQIQGIELYNMLYENMRLERDVKRLNEEISELHNFVSFNNERITNSTLNMLTVLGALFIIPTFITGLYGMNIFEEESIIKIEYNSVSWIACHIGIPMFIVLINLIKSVNIYQRIKKAIFTAGSIFIALIIAFYGITPIICTLIVLYIVLLFMHEIVKVIKYISKSLKKGLKHIVKEVKKWLSQL